MKQLGCLVTMEDNLLSVKAKAIPTRQVDGVDPVAGGGHRLDRLDVLPVPRVEGGSVQQEEDLAVGGAGRAVVDSRSLGEKSSALVASEHWT